VFPDLDSPRMIVSCRGTINSWAYPFDQRIKRFVTAPNMLKHVHDRKKKTYRNPPISVLLFQSAVFAFSCDSGKVSW